MSCPTEHKQNESNCDHFPGELLASYEPIAVIGMGSEGVVYQVRDRISRNTLALKVLDSSFQDGIFQDGASNRSDDGLEPKEEAAKYPHEARILSKLSHPHIVKLFAAGYLSSGEGFLVEELITGQTLDMIAAVPPVMAGSITAESKGNFTLKFEIVMQLAQVLEYVHEREILVRDLSAQNIVITNVPHFPTLKLIDFGMARVVSATTEDSWNTTAGTSAFAAPEQINGTPVDLRADIYSFGVLTYYLLTGHSPFSASTNTQSRVFNLIRDLPSATKLESRITPRLEALIGICTERHPEKRYKSFVEVNAELKEIKRRMFASGGAGPSLLDRVLGLLSRGNREL